VGYYFGRTAWGRGYATEAARACLRFGFGDRNLSRIVAVVRLENQPSRHVLEKIGMRHERDGHFYGFSAALYGIGRDQFTGDAS
jgi:ribosomal-protein-alanine N-acetyltransferase